MGTVKVDGRGTVELDLRVMNAAVPLIAERGCDATGIRDIAQAAGISSSTLYWHVGTKENLLVAVMRAGFDLMNRLGQEALASEERTDRKLAALVRAHVLMHIDHQDLGNVVDSELRYLGPEALAAIMPVRDEYGRLWEDLINRGIEEGVFRVGDPHLARLGVLEMCNGVGRWYRPDGVSSKDEIADAFVELVFGALGAALLTDAAP